MPAPAPPAPCITTCSLVKLNDATCCHHHVDACGVGHAQAPVEQKCAAGPCNHVAGDRSRHGNSWNTPGTSPDAVHMIALPESKRPWDYVGAVRQQGTSQPFKAGASGLLLRQGARRGAPPSVGRGGLPAELGDDHAAVGQVEVHVRRCHAGAGLPRLAALHVLHTLFVQIEDTSSLAVSSVVYVMLAARRGTT